VSTPFQREILQHVADFADRFRGVGAIYVFGSVACGADEAANDVDLAVDFPPIDELVKDPSYVGISSRLGRMGDCQH